MNPLPPPLERVDDNHVRVRGRTLLFFGGCDYLRLARHPRVLRAAARAVERDGLNVGASRKTTGNHPVYTELERRLEKLLGAERALLVSSGYSGGIAVAQGMAGEFSHVLLDERAHPALADAALFFRSPVRRYRHLSVDDVRRIVKGLGRSARPVLLTDGLFAHSGNVAPLRELLRALPRRALIVVDDAHGAGVLGAEGRGTLEHCGVDRGRIVQCVTLSKAFGAYGGAVLGNREWIARIIAKSGIFVGNTPLPQPLARAAIAALDAASDGKLRKRLMAKVAWVKSALRRSGLAIPEAPGPMLPLILPHAADVARLNRELRRQGILPPCIRYPGGPANGAYRFIISATHTHWELERLVEALRTVGKWPG